MRRKDREIQSREEIDGIIFKAEVCRLGLCNNNQPYIVSVSFGYDGKQIFFHSATEGMKIDYIAENNQICFEMECDTKIVGNDERACSWTHSYHSVIGFGIVNEIIEIESKKRALNQIMKHYSSREWEFDPELLQKARLWSISISTITGKHRKNPND
jgi:nitroimidazol reductase NimA-like FMN-containing flavoprotein (pyridoxamine 5'-phosphate oxidase superfamily)